VALNTKFMLLKERIFSYSDGCARCKESAWIGKKETAFDYYIPFTRIIGEKHKHIYVSLNAFASNFLFHMCS